MPCWVAPRIESFLMRILIVKLSSLGDVVHAMPAVQDLVACVPGVQLDWVVERAFAPLVARCRGVQRVISCDLRRWRKALLSAKTRQEWAAFKLDLQAQPYDAVIDLQGLTKSAWIARLARLTPSGKRYALANQTEGSGYEAPTRWLADVAYPVAPHTHAVQRARLLCAMALSYKPSEKVYFGLLNHTDTAQAAIVNVASKQPVVLVHGTSRADKCWPAAHWLALGQRLLDARFAVALVHGNDAEQHLAQQLAHDLGPPATVWPRMDLATLTDRLAGSKGVIGVDSGLSHIAVALNLPHVQIYNFPTAWRTGPEPSPRQCSVYGQPAPTVDAVWQAWQQIQLRG
jgi:heptosyltransferase I